MRGKHDSLLCPECTKTDVLNGEFYSLMHN